MRKKRNSEKFYVLLIALGVLTCMFAFAGENGPNSGSGGNCANNGKGNTVWIYHKHGNGTYSLVQAPVGALSGHAAHGDLWYHTGCPLTGPAEACQ